MRTNRHIALRSLIVGACAGALLTFISAAAGAGNAVPLTSGSMSEFQQVYSPDGGKIAFYRLTSVAASTVDLFVMNSDGTHERRLTFDGIEKTGAPVWSPDSTKLAFGARVDHESFCCDYEVFSVNVDGRNLTNLTRTPLDAFGNGSVDVDPTWSPDGSQIAFISSRKGLGGTHIYRMDADGSNQVDLSVQEPTFESVHDIQPAWSGTKIAFTRTILDSDEFPFDIHVMNSDGSGVQRLSTGRHDSMPVWSPNGQKLAFVSSRSGDQTDAFVMNADGSGDTKITNASAGGWIDLSWSPDAARLAYSIQGVEDVYVVNVDGTGTVPITDHPAADLRPVWSPGGTEISFLSSRPGVCRGAACNLHIWRIEAPKAG